MANVMAHPERLGDEELRGVMMAAVVKVDARGSEIGFTEFEVQCMIEYLNRTAPEGDGEVGYHAEGEDEAVGWSQTPRLSLVRD